jgi:hypothetical protein
MARVSGFDDSPVEPGRNAAAGNPYSVQHTRWNNVVQPKRRMGIVRQARTLRSVKR